jgi:hypothetical protein
MRNEKGLFDRLDSLNGIMRQIADNMPKRSGKVITTFETAVLIVSIFGVVGVADIIIKWITGG